MEVETLKAADVERCNIAISTAEKDHLRRFRSERDRNSYRAAHALARFALSSCETSVPPDAWVFEETAQGRPEISAGHGVPALRFNISHTRSVVACIVTRGLDCGVDVESINCCSDHHDLDRSVLAPSELSAFAAVADTKHPTLLDAQRGIRESARPRNVASVRPHGVRSSRRFRAPARSYGRMAF